MTYYNNNTPYQRCILQCIMTTVFLLIIIGLIMMGVEPTISIYILIPSISSLVLIMLLNMAWGCYSAHRQERLRKTFYTINPLPLIPPIVILQGNSIMIGTPIQTQPMEHTIIPMYMATIDFNK